MLYFSNFNSLLDFLWVIEVFHSSPLVIMQSSRKYNKPNRKEQGDLALGMICFGQFVTSSARLDTVSLKSIKRILGGGYLGRTDGICPANKLVITHVWYLQDPVKVWWEVATFRFGSTRPASSRVQKKQFFWCHSLLIRMQSYQTLQTTACDAKRYIPLQNSSN